MGRCQEGRPDVLGDERDGIMKKSWDRKWYTDEFLRELKATERTVSDGNLKIIEKHAPDAKSDLGVDPRLLGGPLGRNAKRMALLPGFIVDNMKMKLSGKGLANFRENSLKPASATCTKAEFELTDTFVAAEDGYRIPVRIYRDGTCGDGCGCLYFMHGGGFVGGGPSPYDEVWKVFVEKFHMVVVSVDYRLLPENPYPTLYDDCFCVLQWIYHHSDVLHIDRTRIFVTGDSAGGNLAQSCSTRAKGTDMVRGQLLLYATLNLFCVEDDYYRLDGKNFSYEPTQKRISRCITSQMKIMVDTFHSMQKDVGITEPDPYCNPYTFDAAGNPPTFISVGALDFLKNDNIAWAHKLQDAGVPVEVIVYNGMGHGYLSAMGVFPQAEDVIDEMGAFIRKYS